MLISVVLAVVLSILAVFFANANPTLIQVNVMGHIMKGSVGLIIVIAAGLGALAGVLLMLPAILSRSWSVIRYRRKLEDLQHQMQATQSEDMPEG